ncbi:hypothetical protein ACTHPH_15160 [Paenibacillus pasadenensis]|uniref:Uncharacterized protein n=1 Tax=Paenibacillus pasadenensis TaxID=217090 RepID=A0A2N5N4M8_9BACL|nr:MULTISPECIES: hypothetical protein [Paenibacillus]PLT45273.1 hypothetical protein B8V81_3704 [Paenibacillus pasadenensis]QGG55679.1 hypothetical protein GE073_08925 [Paenibacillus sp. B01]
MIRRLLERLLGSSRHRKPYGGYKRYSSSSGRRGYSHKRYSSSDRKYGHGRGHGYYKGRKHSSS